MNGQAGFHSLQPNEASAGWGELHASSIDLTLPVDTIATGMRTALTRSAKINIRQARLELASPRVVSLAIGRPPAIRTKGFLFPIFSGVLAGSDHVEKKPGKKTNPVSEPGVGNSRPGVSKTKPDRQRAKTTRIKPPDDAIKLEDRLFYVLQPPLETWMRRASLEFPFKPFPYQFDGIAFLYPRHAAVLADEMGLGKTMQAITTIRLLLHSGEISSVLLICPKPLVTNWQRELELWAPELPVMVIEGDQARRRWLWSLPCAVKIANYELLSRDRDLLLDPDFDAAGASIRRQSEGETSESDDASSGPGRPFDLVILDESQRIKNRSSTTSQIVRALARRRSWALTGTPVENSAEDLVGIFEFVAPGFLSPQMKPHLIGKAVSEYVLRRTKDMVLSDMPPKLYRDIELDLTPQQSETYRMAEEDGVLRLTEMGRSATISHVFELVLRLKQICNFDPATGCSAKMERLEADLEEVARSGKKAIVFSQWVGTLQRLSKSLRAFHPLEYHGGIPNRRRDGIIERFRQDPNCHVLLISYGAGGLGLNLQFSQYVFLFDRWWNPAVEDQAINRAHRIGVAGPVTVSRFIILGTIEQRIDEILREKREIFDAIFSETAEPTRQERGLTREQIFGLFKMRSPSGSGRAAA